MTEKYTAADFANARFAEHEYGSLAHRVDAYQWRVGPGELLRERDMPAGGWVPVPTKPTITVSQYRELIEDLERRTTVPSCAFERAGIEVIPDPEPTNTELLDADIQAVDQHLTSRQLAEALTELGWKKD